MSGSRRLAPSPSASSTSAIDRPAGSRELAAPGDGDGERRAREFAGRPHGALVDGRLDPLDGAPRTTVEDPATETAIGSVPVAGAAAVDRAVAAARAAWLDGRWSGRNPAEQEAVLRRAAALVRDHGEELAWLETLDNGKTLAEARGDIGGTAAVLDYYAGWPTKLAGDVHATDRRFLALSVGEPVGVCAQIVPWNYPLLMASWKLGPALAAGCTVVLKPAEQTPLSALRLGELLLEAGLPAGVVNVVTGDGTTGAALAAHPDVRKVAFTGSTAVGRAVMAAGAPTVKRVTLELGGKNPNVVFADADLDAAVDGALTGAFENGGQACIAGSRLLVERSIHDEVVARLAERASALRAGPGWEDGVDLGPLVSAAHLAHVSGYVRGAGAEGAAVATPGWERGGTGHFMGATVVGGVTPAMRIFREEVFGPVVSVTPFDSEAEAIGLANDTEYGLAAGVWTGDARRAVRAARALRAGTVWVNAYGSLRPEVPFGGMGQSGVGRELGAAALAGYRETKAIFIAA